MNRYTIFTALAVIALMLTACITTGPVQTVTERIELDGAERASVQVNVGAGRLQVGGGADTLMDAEFTYNVEEWAPEVEYTITGDRGLLAVQQPRVTQIGLPVGNARYEWDLRFTEDIPLEMELNLGAGENNLALGGLNLDRLDVETGAGDVEIDLRGEWEEDLAADLEGGVGQLTVLLPESVNSRVHVERGIGTINTSGLTREGDAYVYRADDSEVTLTLDIEMGVGEVNLRVTE